MIFIFRVSDEIFDVQPVISDQYLPMVRRHLTELPDSIKIAMVALSLAGAGIRDTQFGVMINEKEWQLEDTCLNSPIISNAA